MQSQKDELLPLVEYFARKYKIPFRFLAALVQTESSFDPNAMRYEPGYIWLYSVKELCEIIGCSRNTLEVIQRCSYGLTQLMGAVIYENFQWNDWPVKFFDPEVNLKFGCEWINKVSKRQNISFANPLDLYAAYNAGSVRYSELGVYVNASNVSNFKKNYEMFKDLI